LKRNLIIFSGVFLLILSVIGTTVVASQKEENEKYSLKIIYDNKYVLDEKVSENSNIIIEYEGNVIKDFQLDEHKKITLDKVDLPNNKIISHWQIKNDKENKNNYIITPVLVDKNEIDISFNTTNGGDIKINKNKQPSVVKTVKEGTSLAKVAPDIKNQENYIFAGWYTLGDIEKKVELEEDEVKEKEEEVKNLKKKLKEKEEDLEDEEDKKDKKSIEKDIENLKSDIENINNNMEYKTEVIHGYSKINNLDEFTLEDQDEIIAVFYPDTNKNGKDDRKEKINITIDFGIDNEVEEKEIHVGQPIKLSKPYHEDNIFIDWYLDEDFTEELGEKRTFEKDTTIYAKWKTPQEIVSESEDNLIKNKRITQRIEEYLSIVNKNDTQKQKEEMKEKEKELEEKYAEDNAQHTEKRYSLRNINQQQTFLIKFYDNEEYLFSIALPFGRTIELLNDNNDKIKEYGVRQNTSIDLSEFIDDSKKVNFSAKTVKEKNAVITKIYPNK